MTLSVPALAQSPASVPRPADETTLPAVRVKDQDPLRPQAGGLTSRGVGLGVLGAFDTLDTPFSVVGFTAKAIADRQAGTVGEVLANDPSVRVSVSPGGLLDAFYIRGFPVNEGNLGEFGFDGVFGVAPNYRVFTEYVERVELIKGPTALLNGMAPNGAMGGSVNLVPKRATRADLTRIGVGYASSRQLETRLDIGRRFGEDRALGVRVNAGVQGGETLQDRQERQAAVGAIALDYQASRWRSTLDLIAQREDLDAPSRPVLLGPVATVPAVPEAPAGRRNVSQAWEFSRVEDQSALWRVEGHVTDGVVAFADVGAARTSVDRLFGNPTLVNASGDLTWTPARFSFEIQRQTANAGARIAATTGALHHALTVQASTYRDRLSRGSRNGAAVTSNLHTAPVLPSQSVAPPDVVAKVSESQLNGLAVADTIAWPDARLQMTVGARLQQVRSDNFGPNGAVIPPAYDDEAVTPVLGLVFRPSASTAVYANYIEGLSKGDIAPANAGNAGAALAPYRARQLEVGAKWEVGGLVATLAAFQITKPNGQLAAPGAAASEQRHRGIELGTSGAVTPSLRLLAGVTALDAQITQSSNAAVVGKKPVGVPAVQANATADWDVPGASGVALSGTVAYAAKQHVDAANLRSIPAWTRLDAGLRWQGRIEGRATAVRLGVRNVLDAEDWVGVSSFGGLAQGAPRTVHLSGTVDF